MEARSVAFFILVAGVIRERRAICDVFVLRLSLV